MKEFIVTIKTFTDTCSTHKIWATDIIDAYTKATTAEKGLTTPLDDVIVVPVKTK
jgi:hypothetical protein